MEFKIILGKYQKKKEGIDLLHMFRKTAINQTDAPQHFKQKLHL